MDLLIESNINHRHKMRVPWRQSLALPFVVIYLTTFMFMSLFMSSKGEMIASPSLKAPPPFIPKFTAPAVFKRAYKLQFYRVVAPYLIREHQRAVNPYGNGIRVLLDTDPDITGNLEGRLAIITGGSRGLGVEAVKTFLRKGAHVITTASSPDEKKMAKRYEKITQGLSPGKWKLEIWPLDLMSMDSVMTFINRFKALNATNLHYFLGNAGVMFPKFKLSQDGFESQFSINYLGHVLMSYHLLPYLRKSSQLDGIQSRLVLTTSCLHHIPNRIRWNDLQSLQVYSPHYAYGLSKISVMMFIYKLAQTLESKTDWSNRVKVFTVHPGLVDTDLLDTIEILKQYPGISSRVSLRTVRAGAETLLYAALSDTLNRRNGLYFEDSAVAQSSRLSQNQYTQNRMWMATKEYLKKWTDGAWFEDL